MELKKIRELEQRINSDYNNTIGIVVLKDGNLSYEKYFMDCTRESRVHIYSVTKSIISVLIGIALDKQYIKSIDQKVLDFFPEYKVKKEENTIQSITIKDMLTMTAPYKYRFLAPYIKYFTSDDWVTDQMGIQTAGWGLTLTPIDMAKVGQLYLNDGMWENRRIVSEKWIKESTTEHSRWKKRNLPWIFMVGKGRWLCSYGRWREYDLCQYKEKDGSFYGCSFCT